MRMAYQRRGGALIRWDQGASPRSHVGQGRAADSLSLGALEETGGMRVVKHGAPPAHDGNYEPVPKQGAPEIIGDTDLQAKADNLVTLALVGGAAWYLFFRKGSKYRITKR